MRKQFSIVLLLIAAFTLHAETPEQLFDEGNQAYRQGKFSDAIQKYEQVLQTGNMNGELYYNLGNAYYKAGTIGKAILNYERAMKLLPNDDDVRHNLQLASMMITDKIDPVPKLFVWEWWDAVKSAFTLDDITWLGYICFLGLIIAFAVMLVTPSYVWRRAALFAGTASFLLLLVSGVIFAGKLNDIQTVENAIVTANITTVKNSPDIKSTDAFVLHGGIKVSVTDRVNNWLKIRLADGKVGWAEQSALEII